jgi:hypothetical protein
MMLSYFLGLNDVNEQGKQHHLFFSAVSCKIFMHKTNPRMHSLSLIVIMKK